LGVGGALGSSIGGALGSPVEALGPSVGGTLGSPVGALGPSVGRALGSPVFVDLNVGEIVGLSVTSLSEVFVGLVVGAGVGF